MINIDDIKNVSFRKANFGGYNPEDVDTFIDEVQIYYNSLLDEKIKLLTEIKNLNKKIDNYRSGEESIRNAIISAQRFADESIYNADVESKQTVQEAEHKALMIISKAKDEAQKELERAQTLRNQVIKFKNEIISAYRKHLSFVTNLPEPVFIDFNDEKTSENDSNKEKKAPKNINDKDDYTSNKSIQNINKNAFPDKEMNKKYSRLKMGKNYKDFDNNLSEPIFMNSEEEKTLNNYLNNDLKDIDKSDKKVSNQKIDGNIFSSEDIEKKYNKLKFKKSHDDAK